MKARTLSALAVSFALAMPAFADDSHHPDMKGAMPGPGAQPDAKTMQQMQGNLTTMQKQLDRLAKAKTPEERQKIMTEHMATMQNSMGMAKGMQSGMTGCPMMSEGMGMMGGQGMHGGMGMMGQGMPGGMGMMGQGMSGGADMMAKRMEMMEKRMDMMQMMMQQGGMPMMPQGGAAKPAN